MRAGCCSALGAPDPRVRPCAPCAAATMGDVGLGGAVSERVLEGCTNRVTLGAFIAAARVEAQVKGALAGALVGAAAMFIYLAAKK